MIRFKRCPGERSRTSDLQIRIGMMMYRYLNSASPLAKQFREGSQAGAKLRPTSKVGHEHGSSESHNTAAIHQIVLTVENKKTTLCTDNRAFVTRTRFLRSTTTGTNFITPVSAITTQNHRNNL